MTNLTGALNAALSGLRTTQAGLDLVGQNVANAETPGYSRRRLVQTESVVDGRGNGVRFGEAQRVLDTLLQRQLRTETSGAAFAQAQADVLGALDALFGAPENGVLTEAMGDLTNALQALATDPASTTARANAVGAASAFAATLNDLTDQVQDLRLRAEGAIGDGVRRADEILQRIGELNKQVVGYGSSAAPAGLLDERDRLLDELATYLDVRAVENRSGAVSVFTNSGLLLADQTGSARLSFDGRSAMSPDALTNADPALRGVGTITMRTASGATIDLSGTGAIRSGTLAAFTELRDRTLPEVQRALDELAAGLAGAVSNRTSAGAAALSGAATGFDVDLAGLQPGNAITLDYVETPAGIVRRATIIRVDDATQLPLPQSADSDSSDLVIGVNFGGGFASAASDIQAALGPGFAVSAAGSTLRVLDDGAGGTRDVRGLSAGITVTGFATGAAELPLFVDASSGQPYTGSFEGGSQRLGFAGRIALNPAVAADRSRLVVFSTTPPTPQGDATRPTLLVDRLTKAARNFAPESGVGGTAAGYRGTVADFARRLVERQGERAEVAARVADGQAVVVDSLAARAADVSGVNIDEEMANLVQLQNAYAANARIVSAVREMMDLLLRL